MAPITTNSMYMSQTTPTSPMSDHTKSATTSLGFLRTTKPKLSATRNHPTPRMEVGSPAIRAYELARTTEQPKKRLNERGHDPAGVIRASHKRYAETISPAAASTEEASASAFLTLNFLTR